MSGISACIPGLKYYPVYKIVIIMLEVASNVECVNVSHFRVIQTVFRELCVKCDKRNIPLCKQNILLGAKFFRIPSVNFHFYFCVTNFEKKTLLSKVQVTYKTVYTTFQTKCLFLSNIPKKCPRHFLQIKIIEIKSDDKNK